jgi:hypothetical protein
MPVIEDQITTLPARMMPVMEVIEAQRTSILVPHDHLHNNHEEVAFGTGLLTEATAHPGRSVLIEQDANSRCTEHVHLLVCRFLHSTCAIDRTGWIQAG